MTLRFAFALALALAVLPSGRTATAQTGGPLRVCADADYMPYSTRDGKGFENKVALTVARALGKTVAFTWDSERGRGGFEEFLDRTLRARRCDVVVNVPYASENLSVTRPYYISSYVFVFPRNKHYAVTSMDSPVLRNLRIGFETDTPAEMGLKLRALITHAQPFDVGGDPSLSPSAILDAVQRGTINVAVTWEPSIGYFLRSRPSLAVVPVPNTRALGSPEQYNFAMAMATRPDDKELTARLDDVITRHRADLQEILTAYGVRLYRPQTEPR